MNKNTGFTLIELVIVTAIIGILATAIISFMNPVEYQKVSRDSLRVSALNNISQALELYFADNKSYPSDVNPENLPTILLRYNSRITFSDPSNCLISYKTTPSGYILTAAKESKSFSIPSGQTLVKINSGVTISGCAAQNTSQEVINLSGGQ